MSTEDVALHGFARGSSDQSISHAPAVPLEQSYGENKRERRKEEKMRRFEYRDKDYGTDRATDRQIERESERESESRRISLPVIQLV